MHPMGGASMMVNSQGFPLSGSGSTGNGNVNMMGGMGLNNQSFNQGYNNHAGNAQQVSMGQPQQANVMVDQASMGGMGGFHGMGGAPMGGASMGGAPMGALLWGALRWEALRWEALLWQAAVRWVGVPTISFLTLRLGARSRYYRLIDK